jgi:hypothetical protein
MSCILGNGRLDFSCKTIVGGLSNIYVVEFDKDNFSAITAGAVTLADSILLHQFELVNDGNTFDESNEVARDAGTSTFTETGALVLKGLDVLSQESLQKLSKSKVQVVVEYRDGTQRVVGLEFGADFTIGTTSGGAIGDLQGYNVAFTAMSTVLAPYTTIIAEDIAGSPIDPMA